MLHLLQQVICLNNYSFETHRTDIQITKAIDTLNEFFFAFVHRSKVDVIQESENTKECVYKGDVVPYNTRCRH